MRSFKGLMLVVAIAALVYPQDVYAASRHHNLHATKQARAHGKAKRHFASVDRSAAYADIVIDAKTGQILHETESTGVRHPASLTKMMTLYLTFQALEAGRVSLNQYLPVSENASAQSPSKLGLRAGQRIRVEDAILGVVTESANDAAVTLAEGLGGSEAAFADLMTRQARALGMNQTVFRNPSGLPNPEQVTSARDMAILGVALINHYPKYYPYFNRSSFTYAGVYHHNHNHLMDRYEGMDGIKTGYIRASGFNLVASVKRGDRRVVAVVFGGKSAVTRDNHMASLLDDSFGATQVAQAAPRPQPTPVTTAQNDYSDEDAADDPLPAKPLIKKVQAQTLHTLQPPKQLKVAARGPLPQQKPAQVQTVAMKDPVPPQQPHTQTLAQTLSQQKDMSDSAPPQEVSTNDSWGVQIGAFSNPDTGREALATLMNEVSGLPSQPEPQVQKIATGGIVMYRARLMALDKKTAQNLCAHLNELGKSCLTVEQ